MGNNFWLDDDPEWQELKRRTEGYRTPKVQKTPTRRPVQTKSEVKSQHSRPGQTPIASPKTADKKIELSLTIPATWTERFEEKKLDTLEWLSQKKLKLTVVGGVVIMAGSILLFGPAFNDTNSPTASSPDQQVASANTAPIVLDEPDFEVLLPTGRTTDDFIKSETRLTPSNEAIFSYNEMLNGVAIEVTQQKLPESFAEDRAGQLEKLAENFNLSNVISVDGVPIYHGVSDQQGIQSLVTIKESVMVFIRSPQKLSDDVWAGYVTALQK